MQRYQLVHTLTIFRKKLPIERLIPVYVFVRLPLDLLFWSVADADVVADEQAVLVFCWSLGSFFSDCGVNLKDALPLSGSVSK